MTKACCGTCDQARLAAEEYTELHEGRPPDRMRRVPTPRPRGERLLGRVEAIQYLKKIPGKTPSYRHPFAPHAQPNLRIDRSGRIVIEGVRYTVTAHGIEDLPRGRRTRYVHSPAARRLVALGKLEWIRYNDGRRSKVLEFDGRAAPTLAHDDVGKLHALGGHYSVTEEDDMARRRRKQYTALANPRRSRRSRRRSRRMALANPTASMARGLNVKEISRVLLSAMGVSAAAIGTEMLGERLLRSQAWSPSTKAVAQGVGGAVLSSVSSAFGAPPMLSAGLAVGGMLPAMKKGLAIYQASRAASPALPPGGRAFPAGFAQSRAYAYR